MPINVPAITWTEQADPTSPIASYAYSLSAADDISFGLNAERFGIVTRPRFVSVDNTRNTGSVTVRMYNASYTILGSQAQTVPIQAKTDRLQIIGANGTLGVTFFLNEPYAAGVNYSELLTETGAVASSLYNANLYVGIGAARSINSGIKLLTNGGIVIIKQRNGIFDWYWYDTVRGEFIRLVQQASSQSVVLNSLSAFNDTGFLLGTSADVNNSGSNYIAYSMQKASGFLDIVTYVGNGAASRALAHSLGATPGIVFVKSLQAAPNEDWFVQHKDLQFATWYLRMNSADSAVGTLNVFGGAATDTEINLGPIANVAGVQYVAYVFAHNPAGSVQCGFYNGNGSASGPTINLGKRARFVFIKARSGPFDWICADDTRGSGVALQPNNAGAEVSGGFVNFTATGFQIITSDSRVNANTVSYVYWAITDP